MCAWINSRNPLLIGSTVLTDPEDGEVVDAEFVSQSPPNRVNGSHQEKKCCSPLLSMMSQSPPNRVNGSHALLFPQWLSLVGGRNPLLIGSTVLTLKGEPRQSQDCRGSQSPPNRVNGSHIVENISKRLEELLSQSPPNRVNGSHSIPR